MECLRPPEHQQVIRPGSDLGLSAIVIWLEFHLSEDQVIKDLPVLLVPPT